VRTAENRAKHDPEAAQSDQPREHSSDTYDSECMLTQRDVVESNIVLDRAESVVFARAEDVKAMKRPKIKETHLAVSHVQPREH
jgi:hypothetical protein